MGLTPSERTLRARLAAHRLHGTVDSTVHTEPARRAFLSKFETEADPEGVLSPAERSRRAEQLKRAYFAGLALKSSKARRARKAGGAA